MEEQEKAGQSVAAAAPSPVQTALSARFADLEFATLVDGTLLAKVPLPQYLEVCRFARDELGYTHCSSLTCTDHLGQSAEAAGELKLSLHLYRVNPGARDHGLCIRVEGLPRAGGRVPSVAAIWPTNNWHEREAYDMFGLEFTDHPNLQRILLPDNWQGGNPLLKDFADNRPRRPRLIRQR